jgi:hypothetical protein
MTARSDWAAGADGRVTREIGPTELAAHVEKRVPELFGELKQNGWVVKGVAVARGGGGDAQTAHFGSTILHRRSQKLPFE